MAMWPDSTLVPKMCVRRTKQGWCQGFWSKSGKNDVPMHANKAYLEFSFRYNISKTVKHLGMYRGVAWAL